MANEEGAICSHCQQNMLKADGCTWTHIKFKDGQILPRSTDCRCGETRRCHDCGSRPGQPHHFGCDNETCARCGGQAAFCDCGEAVLLRLKKQKPERG